MINHLPLLLKERELNSPSSPNARGGINEKEFFRLVKFGFSAKRKMLKNNLAGGFKIQADLVEKILIKNNLNPKTRAEDLSLEDWYKIFADFLQFMV